MPSDLAGVVDQIGGWSSGHVHGFLSGQESLVVPDVGLFLVELEVSARVVSNDLVKRRRGVVGVLLNMQYQGRGSIFSMFQDASPVSCGVGGSSKFSQSWSGL